MKTLTPRVFRSLAVSTVIATSITGMSTLIAPRVEARSSVTVGLVGDIAGWNPYADSTPQTYSLWCQSYGCLGLYDPVAGDWKGMLAERWEVDRDNPNLWTFYLRKGLKRHHDGRELTAEDVLHSLWRNKNDPRTAQTHATRPVKSGRVLDRYTIQFTTTEPTALLHTYLSDRFIITSKDLYDKYGPQVADRKYPWGWGPYMVKDLEIGKRIVMEKNPNWPGIKATNPDRIIFRVAKEAEVRVTGLLNDEFQIAQNIPPHLISRIDKKSGVHIAEIASAEVYFLGMNPAFKPWDNKLARQAVAYAIDRRKIIDTIFQGHASILHGPVGKGQYGYNPDVGPKYSYDPVKARALLKQAGLEGVEIDFSTMVNFAVNDRQAAQAMVPMLEAAGFKVKLRTPEFSTWWPRVRKGKEPFFYNYRGSVMDPSIAMAQYFETGQTPRLAYSNPELDKVLAAERAEFDPKERKKLLQKAFSILLEDVPAHFLWRLNTIYGVSDKLNFTPTPNGRIFGTEILVK